MGISELLTQLADPETIRTLSFTQKMTASMVVTMLGMGITFIALIVLQIIIGLLAKFTANPNEAPASSAIAAASPWQKTVSNTDEDELVAVITAAIAMYPQHPQQTLVIRNIRKIEMNMPAWNRTGVLDQMNSRI